MLNKSSKIINVFAKNPTKSYLFGEIKKLIESKSESYTYNNLNFFVQENILIKEQKGNLMLYKISTNPKSISFLSCVTEYNAWNSSNLPLNNISDLIKKIDENFFSLLVTGSYANGKQNFKSDLDVVLIVQSNPKKIMARVKHFCEMTIPKIHLHIFTYEEFKQMLSDKKHNYGKEIVMNNFIFYGSEIYYKLLFEVMENGFSY